MKKSEDLWASALERLGKGDRHQAAFDGQNQITILSDLQSLTETARDECIKKRWRFRRPDTGETIILRDLFGKIVSWINLFKQIGDNAVQYDPHHAALPWAGIRFILQVAVSDIVKFEFVVESVEAIARVISRYAIFEDIYLHHPSPATEKLKEALVGLYAAILLYLSKAKAFFQRSTTSRLLKGAFVAEEEFQELSTKINLEQSEVDRSAVIVQKEGHNSMSDTLDALALDGNEKHAALLRILCTIDGPINRMDTKLQGLENHMETSKRNEILSWISSQPYLEHHEQIKCSDVPERGKWLLEDPVYTRWHKESVCSLLWLHGKVGSGKSTLTAIVIDDALRRSAAGQNPPPVYFYCSRNAAEPERSDPDSILASIVRQLSCVQPGVPLRSSVIEKYDRKGQGFISKGLRLDESRDLILELIEQYRMTTIVIDALDEIDAEKRHALLEVLEDILQDAVGLVKVFVSSRDDQDIVCTLDQYPSLDLASDKNQRDIERFVQTETERLVSKRRLLRHSKCREELKSLIIKQVSEGADGMFRWAALQLEVLCKLKLDVDVRTTLGRLPPGLEELYLEIYEKQISQYRGEAGRATISNILKWLLFAQTQMNSFELRTAVAMDLPISLEEFNKEHILDLCHNFVVFDDALDTFRFAHLSVREFLETRAEYAPVECHVLAAETCLIQLIGSSKSSTAKSFLKNKCAVDVSSKLASTSESIVGGFHKYSTLYWTKHCASIGEESRQSHSRFRELFQFFLSTDSGSPSPLDAWMLSYRHREYDMDAPYYLRSALDEYLSPLATIFLLACAFGFCEIIRESLKNPQLGIEERRAAWDIAAFGVQDEALKTLLTQRGECDIPQEIVERVARSMKAETLAWVLDQARDTKLTPSLVISALDNKYKGHTGKIDVLLSHYDASEVSNEILAAAAGGVSGSKFQDLLHRHKDIKVSELMFTRAAAGKNYEVMELLLDRQDFQLTATMLEDAVANCNSKTLQFMLERYTAPITSRAMWKAAVNEDGGVLQLLLDSGGAVSHPVLVAAAALGFAPVLRMLLNRGQTISRAMLRMGVRNRRDGEAVTKLLLAEADDAMVMGELNEMMKKAVGYGSAIVEALADRAKGITISEDVFMAAAWRQHGGAKSMRLLKAISDRSVLTVEVLEALAKTSDSYESMQLLLENIDNLDITEQILKAAAGNLRFGDELVKFMLETTPASSITDSIWNAAAANEGCGLEVLMLLEKHVGQIDVTEELLITIASTGAPRTMAFLLKNSDNAKITENVIASALKAPMSVFWSDMTMVRLLLEQAVDLTFSEKLLDVAARTGTIEIFKLVWTRCREPKVSSTMLQAAAGNRRSWTTMKFLLDKIEDSHISEELIEAIIDCQEGSALGVLELCIQSKLSLSVTHNILKKAAGKSSASDSLVHVLLTHARNIGITDDILQSAAAAGQHKFLHDLSHHGGRDEVLPRWTDIAKVHDAAARCACYFQILSPIYDHDFDSCDPDADISLIRDLLSRKTPFDLPDGNGSTPLALAAKAGNEMIAKALLDAGADPDSRDCNGRSPLFNAVLGGHYGIAVALLEKGVERDFVDSEGESMMNMAKKMSHMRVFRLLERYKEEGR